MKIRWRNGKAQIVAYVPERGRFEVVDESDSLDELMVKHRFASNDDDGEFDPLEETDRSPTSDPIG